IPVRTEAHVARRDTGFLEHETGAHASLPGGGIGQHADTLPGEIGERGQLASCREKCVRMRKRMPEQSDHVTALEKTLRHGKRAGVTERPIAAREARS